jgi:hypothetical protein
VGAESYASKFQATDLSKPLVKKNLADDTETAHVSSYSFVGFELRQQLKPLQLEHQVVERATALNSTLKRNKSVRMYSE